MPLSDAEFEAILADNTKLIESDIVWQEDEDHSPTVEFKVQVVTDRGYPLFMKGTFNSLIPTITYALISKTSGRIYALDLGKGHNNPDGTRVGDTHKHRWSEEFKDKHAYEPSDITASADDPVQVWQQFCREATIKHNECLLPPPPAQGDLFLWAIHTLMLVLSANQSAVAWVRCSSAPPIVTTFE